MKREVRSITEKGEGRPKAGGKKWRNKERNKEHNPETKGGKNEG